MFNVIKGEFINRNNNPIVLDNSKKDNVFRNDIVENEYEEEEIKESSSLENQELEKILEVLQEKNLELKNIEVLIAEKENEALKNSEAILEDAKKKIEYEFKVSKESGYQEGYQIGENEATETVINKCKEMIGRVIGLVEDAKLTREKILRENEEYLLALSIKIAEKIIGAEVKSNKEIIRNVIGNAIKKVPISKKMTVIVNWEDLEYIKEIKQSLFSEIKGVENIEIIEDSRIHRGGCVLETSIGTIDATIESQLESIKESFIELKENTENDEENIQTNKNVDVEEIIE